MTLMMNPMRVLASAECSLGYEDITSYLQICNRSVVNTSNFSLYIKEATDNSSNQPFTNIAKCPYLKYLLHHDRASQMLVSSLAKNTLFHGEYGMTRLNLDGRAVLLKACNNPRPYFTLWPYFMLWPYFTLPRVT